MNFSEPTPAWGMAPALIQQTERHDLMNYRDFDHAIARKANH